MITTERLTLIAATAEILHAELRGPDELARELVVHALADPTVDIVVAETLPDLVPSIGVLAKLGFALVDTDSEAGVVRYELGRSASE